VRLDHGAGRSPGRGRIPPFVCKHRGQSEPGHGDRRQLAEANRRVAVAEHERGYHSRERKAASAAHRYDGDRQRRQ